MDIYVAYCGHLLSGVNECHRKLYKLSYLIHDGYYLKSMHISYWLANEFRKKKKKKKFVFNAEMLGCSTLYCWVGAAFRGS